MFQKIEEEREEEAHLAKISATEVGSHLVTDSNPQWVQSRVTPQLSISWNIRLMKMTMVMLDSM